MGGTLVVPGVLYLQSLGLARDVLIQAMGLLFLLSTTALTVGMAGHNLLNGRQLLLSLGALLPSFASMAVGRILRRRISPELFAKFFSFSLLLLGLAILRQGLT